MILSFAGSDTRHLFEFGECGKFPQEIIRRALRKLELIDDSTSINDLRMPPGNRLHSLIGDREGFYAISINDQWRICFRFREDGVYDVEICDYH